MKVKVLSLKSATQRRDFMISQLNRVGIDFDFVDSLSPDCIDSKLFENKPWYVSKEAVATFETHRMVINSCKDSSEYTLILEDDSNPQFEDVLSQILELLEKKPQFDILVIGFTADHRGGRTVERISEDFNKINKFIGMHAYIINPNSCDKILNHLGEPNEHVDFRISKLIKDDTIRGIFTKKKYFKQDSQFTTQIPKKKHLINENGIQ